MGLFDLFKKQRKVSPVKIAADNRAMLQLLNGRGITTNQEGTSHD